ncbi:hypothetical protein B4119_0005 [Parageobacillus caldoxylosilyticus]|jgi:hypothetical protein|uniref:Uncharacterized protein n=1 Tax=Saccharococcus caldoxylosilyticus TaxID=81408 RepID=A0A150LIA3_9BACL|nr:hypothetical protein B4119_0005 [Parageobacillus caldoxylosilyticus]
MLGKVPIKLQRAVIAFFSQNRYTYIAVLSGEVAVPCTRNPL